MLRNVRFHVDKIKSCLMHVERNIALDLDWGDKLDPLALVLKFRLEFPL